MTLTNKKCPLIIAGSGRSGTTWILDSIAESNGLSTIFEPLNPILVKQAKPFAFQYYREESNYPDLARFMEKVFSGKFKNLWANYRINSSKLLPWTNFTTFIKNDRNPFNHGKAKLKYFMKSLNYYKKYRRKATDRFIVKFIRANLMLGWLSKNFRAKIILLIRHPAAVVASRLHLIGPNRDWGTSATLELYRKNSFLYEDFLHKYDNILYKPLSLVATLALLWCIENVIPLQKAQSIGHSTLFYEHLIDDPKFYVPKAVNALGLNTVPDQKILLKPSEQTASFMRNGSFGKSQLTRWQKFLNKEQMSDIQQILDRFEFTLYNVEQFMPTIQNHENLISF